MRRFLFVLGAFALTMVGASGASGAGADGFRAASGAEAAAFTVPADMRLVRTLAIGDRTYQRYQQYFGDAKVYGAQVSIYRRATGTIVTVIGSHYRGLAPANAVRLSRADAVGVAASRLPRGEHRVAELMLNPRTDRYFYRVETRAFDLRRVHWIDAANGRVVRTFDALTDDHATGVKGDSKSVAGITRFHASSGHGVRSAHYDLISPDGRQVTYDARNRSGRLHDVTDADNHWTTVTADRASPGQPALTDAQYYANVTDDYFLGTHSFNWTSCYAQQRSVAHYGRKYNNAFWNGTYTVYGDGDGTNLREFSGGLDVVSHEHTHGVTDCTSNLVYQDESGALNESFSDILGNSAEFFAAAGGRDPAAPADWLIGEDIDLRADTASGFRNMGDPREDDDPDHYSERQVGGEDNGGVHSNSAIPNHAYYLLVNGGRNAGCDVVGSNGHAHTADCDVLVTGIDLADAEAIFFDGFTSLPENASMCQARKATEAAAAARFGDGSQQHASTIAAWNAVGVPTSC